MGKSHTLTATALLLPSSTLKTQEATAPARLGLSARWERSPLRCGRGLPPPVPEHQPALPPWICGTGGITPAAGANYETPERAPLSCPPVLSVKLRQLQGTETPPAIKHRPRYTCLTSADTLDNLIPFHWDSPRCEVLYSSPL